MPIENNPRRPSSTALAHLDWLLDQALDQTFPASDAIAIDFEPESLNREARVLNSRTQLAGNWRAGQRIGRKHQRVSTSTPARTRGRDAKQTNC